MHNHQHQEFLGCETGDSSSLSLINSFASVMFYAIGSFYKFLPTAATLFPNIITAAIIAIVSFSVTKGCNYLYRRWFCKVKK